MYMLTTIKFITQIYYISIVCLTGSETISIHEE